MDSFLLQPWITLRGTSTLTTLTQSEDTYLDLSPYQDFVAWLEVSEISAASAPAPSLWLESAPTKEEALFAPLAAVPNGGRNTQVALSVGVTTAKNILNAPLAWQIPLARFLRWRVDMTGASSAWSVTFQIHVAAHAPCLSLDS